MWTIAAVLLACPLSPSSAASAPELQQAPRAAAQGEAGYRQPDEDVVRLVDAEDPPSVRFSPDGRWMLFVERASLPSIADVARPWIGLAGVRIDAAAQARYTTNFYRGLALRGLDESTPRRLRIPSPGRIVSISWSHDSQRFAFTRIADDQVELWAADVHAAEPRRLAVGVNAVLGSGFGWMPDGVRLWCWLAPQERGDPPQESPVPTGPTIQVTAGAKSPVRTYTNLLETPHDGELFEHVALSQLTVVHSVGGTAEAIGGSGWISSSAPSPDGKHWLVTTLQKPFSYVLPYYGFAQKVEVWNAAGHPLHVVADLPVSENVPIGGVRTGRRQIQWKPTADATLVWMEALDGGDPKREVEFRDAWFEQPAPFEEAAEMTFRTEHRSQGAQWVAGRDDWIVSEYDRDERWTRSWWVSADSEEEPRLIEDRSVNDRYGDPGRLLTEPTFRGTRVAVLEDEHLLRTGRGDSAAGARPFLDRQDVESLETERLWRAAPGSYEEVVAVLDSRRVDELRFVTSYQSIVEPPNYRLRDRSDGSITALTEFADPTPELRGVKKQLVTYVRDDGVPLSATLYLPADYVEGTRLPLVVWAYPREFNDPTTAGQVSGSPYRFTRLRGASHLYFLTRGYAVMDGAAMPVIGDPETMNDTFIEQIVAAASAAIDKAVEMGVADPERVGVGGHSYGAFMTANLLAHCDLFRAGVARSGAYNRTLTPFGFQSERRTVWEAPEIYFAISPFMHAHKINEPILLVHGTNDPNSGTYPMQSERLFQALKGNGGTARYVQLPAEGHGYAARESTLHTLAEQFDWFDEHVKNAPSRAEATQAAAER